MHFLTKGTYKRLKEKKAIKFLTSNIRQFIMFIMLIKKKHSPTPRASLRDFSRDSIVFMVWSMIPKPSWRQHKIRFSVIQHIVQACMAKRFTHWENQFNQLQAILQAYSYIEMVYEVLSELSYCQTTPTLQTRLNERDVQDNNIPRALRFL